MKRRYGMILVLIASILYLCCAFLQIHFDSQWLWKKDVDIALIEVPELPTVEEELIEITEVNESEQIPTEIEEVDPEDYEVLVFEDMSDNLKWIWSTLLYAEIYFMLLAGLIGLIFFRNLKRANFLFWLGIWLLALQTLNFIYWVILFSEEYLDLPVFLILFSSTVIYITGAYLNRIVAKASSL